jgi:hypothetical protein
VLQALSLAVAGSFYPVGLLFVLRYLAAGRALFLSSLFLIGGALGCLGVAVLELALLNVLPFKRAQHPGPNGGAYIVLGIGLLAVALLFARRGRHRVEADGEPIKAADPSPVRAFLTGLLIYSPGLGLLAAVKALFDANLSGGWTAVGVVACTAIILWMAEVPIAATAISPRRSAPVLRSAGAFVARNGRLISIGIAAAIGAYLIADGIWIVVGG